MKTLLKFAVRHRWFLLAVLFLALNACDVMVRLSRWQACRPVRVRLVSPSDGLVSSREPLAWRFSSDLAPTSRLHVVTSSGPVTFTPDVKGSFTWTSPHTLVFRPARPWPGCTAFRADIVGKLIGDGDRVVAEPKTFSFGSERLSLRRVSQAGLGEGHDATLCLEFSDEVSPAQLRSHLRLQTLSGDTRACRIIDGGASKTMRVVVPDVGTNSLRVTVYAGLQSTSGPLGLREDATRSLQLTRELRVHYATPEAGSLQAGSVKAAFSAPIDLSTAVEFIRVQPPLTVSVDPYYSYFYGNECRIVGPFRAGQSYTVTFLAGLRSTKGIPLREDITATVYFPDAAPALELTGRGTYLSAKGSMRVPLRWVNVEKMAVTVYRVHANNLVQLAARQAGRYERFYGDAYQGISRPVGRFDMAVQSRRNEIATETVDLRSILHEQHGAFYMEVSAENGPSDSQYIIVSDVGLSVRTSGRQLLVWANSIRTLAPLADARVGVYSLENQLLASGLTDPNGVACLELGEPGDGGEPFLVTVERGDDLTFLPLDDSTVSVGGAEGRRTYLLSGYEAYLYTDRGIYRPGETVHARAIVRGANGRCPDPFPVCLDVFRPDGKLETSLGHVLGPYGTAEFTVTWPDAAATGKYRLEVNAPGADHPLGSTAVSVEEFVPPRIRVQTVTSPEPISGGVEFPFEIVAEHLFGQPAAGLLATACIDFMPCAFMPPQWPGYRFGDDRRDFQTVQVRMTRKVLSPSGKAVFAAKPSGAWRPPAAIKALMAGTVTEVSGRTVTAYAGRMIHIYPFYLGIREDDNAPPSGETRVFRIAAVRPDGTVQAELRSVRMSVGKVIWTSVLKKNDSGKYQYDSERQFVPVCAADVEVTQGTASFPFVPPSPGRYRLTAEDAASGTASSMEFDAVGDDQAWVERSMDSPDVVDLALDSASYAAGDTARLSIKSPFSGKALLTLESASLIEHRVFDLTNNTVEIALPIKADYSPNVYCAVSVIRPVLAEETWGLYRAAGRISLTVACPARKLHLDIDAPAEVRPGRKLRLPVRVTDEAGKGAVTEVVVAAVDEAICMLTGFETPDPYGFFLEPRLPGFDLCDVYAQLMPEVAPTVSGEPSAPGGDALALMGKRLNPIKARRFKPVALWSATVVTGEDGTAEVDVELPEFTGELRLMATAVDATRFASADRRLRVKRPLSVQSSLPRFLAPSDAFSVPVLVYNDTGTSGLATVTMACTPPLSCAGSGAAETSTVFVADGDRGRVEFRLTARVAPGIATCRWQVSLGQEQVSEELQIGVRPPSAVVTLAGSGFVPRGETATVDIPSTWLAGTASARLRLASAPGLRLGGSLAYLLQYPYGCLEQTTSKAFPLLYVADLVERTQPGWLNRGEISRLVQAGIQRVLLMQRGDGSFGLWPGSDTYPWGSIYATHFLVEAAAAGCEVPGSRLGDACAYLEKLARQPIKDASGRRDAEYNRSYACYVLALAGRPQHGMVVRLLEQCQELDEGSNVHTAAALVAAGKRREALALMRELDLGPHAAGDREVGGCLRSSVRNEALLLATWLRLDPGAAAVPVLARRLEASQRNGHWYTTQDDAMALMALGKYADALGSEQKPMSGRVLGDGDHVLSSFSNREEIGLELPDRGQAAVTVRNEGCGGIYYYWTSTGVPMNGEAEELDRGLSVRRQFLDLSGQPVDPDTFRQGDLYVTKITVNAAHRLDNVVIDDLLPAGLEIENARLETSQNVHWLDKKKSLPVLHVDARDDRMVAFTGPFQGSRDFFYAVRAVTTGEFVLPAVSASCMYDPETCSLHGHGSIRVSPQEVNQAP